MIEFNNCSPASLSRRKLLISVLLLTSCVSSSCVIHPIVKPPKILFVCQAGTVKSAIAREIFRQHAKEQGIAVEASSRGIVVEDHVSPQLAQQLRSDRIDTTSERAMPLQPVDWATADILVIFNPLPASVEHKDIRDWSDVPSVNDDYADARVILEKRIDSLLTEIAKKR